MPFFSDLLPKTTNYPSTREGIKDALRDALRKYEQANARGLHSMECDRVAFVYAMCCMRVAKLLRMVTDRQTVGVTMYFLSVAAQKLDAVIRCVENRIALETRDGQTHDLVKLVKGLCLAKQTRVLCTEGAIDVIVTAAGTPNIRNEPRFDARIQSFLHRPWKLDPRVNKVVEHISRKASDCANFSRG